MANQVGFDLISLAATTEPDKSKAGSPTFSDRIFSPRDVPPKIESPVEQITSEQILANIRGCFERREERPAISFLKTYHLIFSQKELNELMQQAHEKNFSKMFRECITYGADVNACVIQVEEERQPLSVLHAACKKGDLKAVKAIFVYYPDANVRDQQGRTPLHLAAANPQAKEVVSFLLKMGADVNAKDSEGQAPLHHAAKLGCDENIKELLQAKGFVDIHDKQGRRPLHFAAFYGRVSTAQLLLQRGAHWRACDGFGRSPMYCAIVSPNCRKEQCEAIEEVFLEATLKSRILNLAGDLMLRLTLRGKRPLSKFEAILSNANGIKNANKRTYEGLGENYPLHTHIARSLEEMPWAWESISRDELMEACRQASPPEEGVEEYYRDVHRRIQDGKLVIIPTGWLQHRFYLVFYKGYMAICNRGGRPQDTGSLEVFKVDTSLLSLDKLKDVFDDNIPVHLCLAFALPEILRGEKDDLAKQLEKGLSNSDQKVGNCSYNIKGALRIGAAFLSILDKGKPPETGIRESYDFSKRWSTYYRMITLNSYLNDEQRLLQHRKYAFMGKAENLDPRDEYLIDQVRKKIAKRQANPKTRIAPTQALLKF